MYHQEEQSNFEMMQALADIPVSDTISLFFNLSTQEEEEKEIAAPKKNNTQLPKTSKTKSGDPTNPERRIRVAPGVFRTEKASEHGIPKEFAWMRVELFHNANAGKGKAEWVLKFIFSEEKFKHQSSKNDKDNKEAFVTLGHGSDGKNSMIKTFQKQPTKFLQRFFEQTLEKYKSNFSALREKRAESGLPKKNVHHVFDKVLFGCPSVKKAPFGTVKLGEQQVFLLPVETVDEDGVIKFGALVEITWNTKNSIYFFLQDVRNGNRNPKASVMVGYPTSSIKE